MPKAWSTFLNKADLLLQAAKYYTTDKRNTGMTLASGHQLPRCAVGKIPLQYKLAHLVMFSHQNPFITPLTILCPRSPHFSSQQAIMSKH